MLGACLRRSAALTSLLSNTCGRKPETYPALHWSDLMGELQSRDAVGWGFGPLKLHHGARKREPAQHLAGVVSARQVCQHELDARRENGGGSALQQFAKTPEEALTGRGARVDIKAPGRQCAVHRGLLRPDGCRQVAGVKARNESLLLDLYRNIAVR